MIDNGSLIPQLQLDEVIRLARTCPANGIIVEVGVYKCGSAVQLMEVAKERGQGTDTGREDIQGVLP